MKFFKKKKSSRWEQDIYIGWVPWSLSRWWAACKIWFLLILFGGGTIMFFLEGVVGVFGLVISVFIFTVFVLLRNRNRGIGLSKNGEIVVFGPHKTFGIPVESVQSVGVLNVSKLAGTHLRDPKGLVSRSSWVGKFWEMAGYQGDREEYESMMTEVATQETRMASGRGKVFVVRDLNGFFWPVSPATGFEIATLRDLALASKIPFFTPSNPFNVSLRASAEEVVPFVARPGKKNKKAKRPSHQNKALQNVMLESPEFEELGGKRVWSPLVRYSFIRCNTTDEGGFHEERIRRERLSIPDSSTQKKVALNFVLRSFIGLTILVFLLFVGPLVLMAQSPTVANGFLTRNWTPPFERIWVAPEGWTIDADTESRNAGYEGVVDVAVFLKGENQRVEVWAGSAGSETSSCVDSIYYGGVLSEGIEVVPEFQLAEGRLYVDLNDSLSIWCQQQLDEGQSIPSTILYRFENVEDPLSFVKEMKTRINL